MKNNEPIFLWDEETGTATCLINENNKNFVGVAICHPEDADMMSEKTGSEIAFKRAVIKVLYDIKYDLSLTYKTLNQLYLDMKMSPKFNENSY